jgi:hypothetical protein
LLSPESQGEDEDLTGQHPVTSDRHSHAGPPAEGDGFDG